MTREAGEDVAMIVAATIIAVATIIGIVAMSIWGTDERMDMVLKGITALGVVFGPLIVVRYTQRVAKDQAAEVKEVKQVLADNTAKVDENTAKTEKKLVAIEATGKENNGLLNSSMGIQLALNADNARWRAERSGEEKDKKAAEVAEAMLAEHQTRQAIVDQKSAKTSDKAQEPPAAGGATLAITVHEQELDVSAQGLQVEGNK